MTTTATSAPPAAKAAKTASTADKTSTEDKAPPKPERWRVRLTFTEPLLGTVPHNEESYLEYITEGDTDEIKSQQNMGLNQQIEELEAALNELVAAKASETEIADANEKLKEFVDMRNRTTGFYRTPKLQPCLYDYQIKGFFKDAQKAINRIPKRELQAYRQKIDGLVFVFPRQIPLVLPTGESLTFRERPLRASTPKGDRIALARSEQAPVGTTVEFEVLMLAPVTLRRRVKEWFNYAVYRGLGQWRNASFGRFTWEKLEVMTQ